MHKFIFPEILELTDIDDLLRLSTSTMQYI